MSKELQIRNSTVDFLVFTRDAGEDGIEVRVQNGDVWLTQKAISQLLLLWGIELIQNGQRSSEHGQPKCWIHLQSRVLRYFS